MAITLRDVTRDNWRHCIRLDPGPEERAFIPSNLYALAEAKFTSSFVPLAIYDDALLVGFAMYDAQPERDGSCSIYSLMIDWAHQGRGYGRAALLLLIERLRYLPGCSAVSLQYDRANERAARLNAGTGFQLCGVTETGGCLARLPLA